MSVQANHRPAPNQARRTAAFSPVNSLGYFQELPVLESASVFANMTAQFAFLSWVRGRLGKPGRPFLRTSPGDPTLR